MKTVLLYGHLGKRFGRVHKFDIRTPAEGMSALCATLPGFRQAVIDGGRYRVLTGGDTVRTLATIKAPMGSEETLRIVPVIAGSKRGGLLQTIVGAILVVIDYVYTDGTSGLSKVGYSLMLGGVSQMLFAPPVRKSADSEAVNNRPSYAFGGAVNTAVAGNVVPVCYGRLIVGSQVVSAGLFAESMPA